MRQVEALLGPQEVGPLFHRLIPRHAAFDVHRVQLRGRRARCVFAQERDGPHALYRFSRRAQVEDAEVEAAGTLRLRYYGGKSVREISGLKECLKKFFKEKIK